MMDVDDPERDCDTDAISITSTVSSDAGVEYDVEDVIAETWDDEGIKYLVKWAGYPLHRCTWEPPEHLKGTSLIQEWTRRRVAMREHEFIAYAEKNITDWEEALDHAAEAKERRQEKRKKKRAKLGVKRSVFGQDSSSEEDIPLANASKLAHRETDSPNSDSLFVQSNEQSSAQAKKLTMSSALARPPTMPRRAPLEQSSSDESESMSESSESGDSLMESVSGNRKKKERTGNKNSQSKDGHGLGNSILQPKSFRPKTHPPSKPAVEQQSVKTPTTVKARDPRPPPSAPRAMLQKPTNTDKPNGKSGTHSSTSALPGATSVSHSTTTASASAASRPAASTGHRAITKSSNPNTAIRSTNKNATRVTRKPGTDKTSGPIKFVDQPKTEKREWQSDKHYATLKFRHNAAKRGQIEKAPDVNSLDFVNGPPVGLPKPKAAARDDNPYGRRDTTNRRVQEDAYEDLSSRDTSRRNSGVIADPLASWEVDKIPLVCPEWRLSSNCKFGPQKCRYMHRDHDPFGREYPIGDMFGWIEPKHRTPPITCMYWYKGVCKKPPDVCSYAHEDTGYTLLEGKVVPMGLSDRSQQLEGRPKQTTQQARKFDEIPKKAQKSKPATPQILTCYFWKTSTCRNSAEACHFAHWDTGVMANSPLVYNPRAAKNGMSVNEIEILQPRIEVGAINEAPDKLSDRASLHHKPSTAEPVETASVPHNRETVAEQPPDDAVLAPEVEMGDNEQLEAGAESTHDSVQGQTTDLIQGPAPEALHEAQPTDQAPASTACLTLKEIIERACRLDFMDMFSVNTKEGEAALVKRAFLIFHPEAHAAELDLVTRWLLMHHVEVSNAWYDGAWNYFKKQTLKSGSGIVIVQPDFEYFCEIPDFGVLLRKNVRLWAVGMQPDLEFDPATTEDPPELSYDRVEIFPHGGFIYLTDEVFARKPRLALQIVKLFIAKLEKLISLADPLSSVQEVVRECLLWRLCVRPELMEYLFQTCNDSMTELSGQDPDHVSRAELYELLTTTNHIEQDVHTEPLSLIQDKHPILSERREIAEEYPMDYFNTLERSQDDANLHMLRYYSAIQVDMRRDYRHFYVVHTEPAAPCVRQWKQELQTIAGVITPEQCIEELDQSSRGSMFDFLDWAMPKHE